MLMLHVEERHTDDSPFVVREGPEAAAQLTPSPGRHDTSSYPQKAPAENDVDDNEWMLCPNPECGEQVQIEDLNEHLDLHYAEGILESQQHQATAHSISASPYATSQSSKRTNGKMRENTPSIASEHSFSAADSSFSSPGRTDGGSRRHHRKSRPRSNSDKSTITRTIRDVLIPDGGKKLKSKKSGSRSARLGVRIPWCLNQKYAALTWCCRKASLVRMLMKKKCPIRSTDSCKSDRRSPSSTASVVMVD